MYFFRITNLLESFNFKAKEFLEIVCDFIVKLVSILCSKIFYLGFILSLFLIALRLPESRILMERL